MGQLGKTYSRLAGIVAPRRAAASSTARLTAAAQAASLSSPPAGARSQLNRLGRLRSASTVGCVAGGILARAHASSNLAGCAVSTQTAGAPSARSTSRTGAVPAACTPMAEWGSSV